MTSLFNPPCLIEHELYVESAVWILHTFSTRECSSNERLRPRGEGGTLMFSYTRRLGPFFGSQHFKFQYFFGFQKNEYFLGVRKIFFGVLEIPDLFGGDRWMRGQSLRMKNKSEYRPTGLSVNYQRYRLSVIDSINFRENWLIFSGKLN